MNAVSLAVLFLLFGCVGVVIYIIASDKTRFLAGFDLASWREYQYLRRLPNFLQALHDRRFRSAWPWRPNAVSCVLFRYRTGRVVRASSPQRRKFMQQHIALFALMEQLRPYIEDFLLHERERIVTERLIDMTDTMDRDRLAAYLDSIRTHRAAFYKSITPHDRLMIVTMIERRFMPTLKMAHAVFQEHGFSLLDEFNTLRLWESLPGAELAQEIPRDIIAIKRLRPTAALKTFNYGAMRPPDEFAR